MVVAVLAAATLVTAVSRPEAEASVWPSSHQRVAEALVSGDVTARRRAAAQLQRLPPKLATGLARRALRDGDVEVRLLGARAAAALGVDKAGDEVVSWLVDRDVRLRVAACELIAAAPTAQSVQALARVLGDSKASVRKAAAAAMGGSGLSDAVSPLLGHLDDGSAAVRLEVVRALGRIGDRRAVVPLVSKLQDQVPDVRREAARSLGQLGDDRATATLMLALQDQSVAVRVEVLDALGRLRADTATAAIAALLSADGTGTGGTLVGGGPVRDAALRALGHMGTAHAVKLLIGQLEEEGPIPVDESGRAPVRRALATAGKPAEAGLLAALQASPSQRLASAAVLALAALPAHEAWDDIVRATQRGTVALDASMTALAALGDARALPFVLEHLDEADGRARQVVVEAATELLDPGVRDGRAIDVVRGRVLDLSASVSERVALVRLLGRTGSPRALPILLSLAEAKPTALRVTVVEALGELGVASPKVDDALLEALADPSQRLRVAAATAIGKVGKDGAARKLLHRLGVSAEQDRGALGIGLSGALGRSKEPALVPQVKAAIAAAPAPARDALIEGLGRMPIPEAGALLGELRRGADVDDRRKIAEALGGHADGVATLRAMLADPDPTVRANATWSLGKVGGLEAVQWLTPRLGDLDVAVAGNAATAIARVATRAGQGPAVHKPLCTAALTDYRSYVRASALTGLRTTSGTCEPAAMRHLLSRDRSWRVRAAAARLLRQWVAKGGADQQLHERALWRCAVEDRDATVAALCSAELAPTKGSHDVLVYVVPNGKTVPTARAPYALVLADGTMRLGVADRRGALFEAAAPDGTIELAVPAALAP
ncbi:MAG: HEAT repeat domain-containing protein [Deltaproteobacteria bacterium]|nr:HEAT repeat domain-containing protein [Deltaproteobacteria bacterium]